MMKRSFRSLIVITFALMLILSACNGLIAQPQPMPTEVKDVPVTEDGQTATEVEPTPVDESLSEDEAMWVGVYEPTEVTSLGENALAQFSEGELSTKIEETVQNLILAAEDTINYINQAVVDNEISAAERDNLYFYCKETLTQIQSAETQLVVYHDVYGADGENAARMEKLYALFQGEVQDGMAVMTDVVTMVEKQTEFPAQMAANLTAGARTVSQILGKLR